MGRFTMTGRKIKKCSVCPDRNAVNESTVNSGFYYCASCSNYVALEYGANRLKPIEENEDNADTL